MTKIIQLVYASIVNSDNPDGTEHAILDAAIKFNRQHDITGFLHKENGLFLQVLEGDSGAIDQVMGRITRDARHHSIEVLIDRPAYIRDFSEWNMAFNENRAFTFEGEMGKRLGNPRDIDNVDAFNFLKACADARRQKKE